MQTLQALLFFSFIFLATDTLLAAPPEQGQRMRFVCQAQTLPTAYMDQDHPEISEPRLIVIDQDKPMDKTFEELTRYHIGKRGMSFTMYAASRLHTINLSDDPSEHEVLDVADEIISREKENMFDIYRQSGVAQGEAYVRPVSLNFTMDLDSTLILELSLPRLGDPKRMVGRYVGTPPSGRRFPRLKMLYRCYGPYNLQDKQIEQRTYYGDEAPETSTRK